MKIKSLMVGMLASAAFVACTNDDELEVINGNESVEKAYLAVNLNYATSGSRSTTTPSFELGTAEENAVNNVSFFFFDADNNAYPVAGNNDSNCLTLGYDVLSNGAEGANIEEVSKPILVISKSKQVPPQKIVAVLNSPFTNNVSTLAALQDSVGAYNTIKVDGKDYFVMSNSVYKNAVSGEEMVATDIPAKCISHDETLAAQNPVQIYVERVAAKVGVTANYAADKGFDTTIKTSAGKAIYAKVVGWEVTNIKNEARLVKKINTAWSKELLGFDWNDAANFRSYWANTETGGGLAHPHTWNATTIGMDAARYYYENTGKTKSQLLVTATFVDEDGVELIGDNAVAEWYGAKYTFADLKEQFANAVATQIYVMSEGGKTAVSIQPEHITFYQESEDADTKRYLCYAELDTEATKGLTFVKGVDEDGEFITMPATEVNEILKAIRPAKIWAAGGYYFLNVAHLGNDDGIVRNHAYQINVNNIKGLGTPVYNPDMIIKPEKPTVDESYIAAKINVLSWKVVSYGVELE